MGFNYSSNSLNDIHKVIMTKLNDGFDFKSAPRGKPIKELVASTFTLTNPRNRIIASPVRKVNYGFAVGELCWYIRGDTDLETMFYYNKRMSQFSDDGKTINSAYGARMLNSFIDTYSQLDLAISELSHDPDSRRAVMHINQPKDLYNAVKYGSKDVPCTMSVQLLIRDRLLHMHVLMRSNDVVWGLPYDVFSFTCIQEAILHKLQALCVPVDDLGSYHHTAGSLHIYSTHFDMAEEVSNEPEDNVIQMEPFTDEHMELLVLSIEPDIRLNKMQELSWLGGDRPNTVDWMVAQLFAQRKKRNDELSKKQGTDEQ